MSEVTFEVLGVTTAYDLETGKGLVQVGFGHYVKVDEGVRARVKTASPAVAVPEAVEKIGSVTLQLFYDFKGVVPYRIGSKWKLSIREDGEMSLKEVKE